MTVVTTRPDTTLDIGGGVVVTGLSGDADAVLADDSDSTYITFDAIFESVQIGFANPTIPSGGVVKKVALRLRANAPSGSCPVSIVLEDGVTSDYVSVNGSIFWASAATWTPLNTTPDEVDQDNAQFSLASVDTSGTKSIRLYAAYLDTTYVAKPVVTVANLTTVTDTNQPTISWTNTLDSDGSGQYFYRVKVFSSAQYGAGGFDPDTSTPTWSGTALNANTSVVVDTPLTNGTYRAYVQVGVLVDYSTSLSSDYAYDQFVIDVAAPPAPSQTLTAHDSTGFIEVDTIYGGGTVTTTGMEIERQGSDGTWSALTSGTGGTIADYYDYLASRGTISYRSRAYHDYSGQIAYSDWTSGSVVYQPSSWFLKHPETSSLNTVLRLKSFTTVEKPARQGTFQALGASKAVVVSESRGSEQGVMEVWADTDSDLDAINALIETGDALFLQPKYDEHEPDRWVSIGDSSAERVIGQAWSSKRAVSLPWIEVETPS